MTTATAQHGKDAGHHRARHTADLAAPAADAYELIADVRRWPLLFTPCLHAEILESAPGTERVRLWAQTGAEVRSWASARTLDPAGARVAFRQEDSAPPLASMGGEWRFEADGAGTRLVLDHDWTLATPDAQSLRWVTEALDRNSSAEIDAVTAWALRSRAAGGIGELLFDFTDTIDIAAPAAAVYAFLLRADRWPLLLPHVARLDLDSTPAGPLTAGAEVQRMEMETLGADGTAHLTRSTRLCFEDTRIVYKQTTLPRPLLGHAGAWTLTPTGSGTRVAARHHVALDPDALASYFGAGTSLAQARARVRELLGGNSRRTLEQARAHTEAEAPHA